MRLRKALMRALRTLTLRRLPPAESTPSSLADRTAFRDLVRQASATALASLFVEPTASDLVVDTASRMDTCSR